MHVKLPRASNDMTSKSQVSFRYSNPEPLGSFFRTVREACPYFAAISY